MAPTAAPSPSVAPAVDIGQFTRKFVSQTHPIRQDMYPMAVRSFLNLTVRSPMDQSDAAAAILLDALERYCKDQRVRDGFLTDYSTASRQHQLATLKSRLEAARKAERDLRARIAGIQDAIAFGARIVEGEVDTELVEYKNAFSTREFFFLRWSVVRL